MGLGSVVGVALASEAEGCGFNPRLDARLLPQHVDPPINWVVTWLWSIVKRLELSKIWRDISLQYLFLFYILLMIALPIVRTMVLLTSDDVSDILKRKKSNDWNDNVVNL